MKTQTTRLLCAVGSSSGAYAISSLAEIAGYSRYSATEQRAAYKDAKSGKNQGWRVLGVLPRRVRACV